MVGGMGGYVPAVRTIIDTIQVGRATQNFILATIVSAISPNFEGLLGMDFLSAYSMRIDSGREVVILEELPEDPRSYGGREET